MHGRRVFGALGHWILRCLHDDGTALVEGEQGQRKIAAGSMLPGTGRVKSIEWHGANWVVISAAGPSARRIGAGAHGAQHSQTPASEACQA